MKEPMGPHILHYVSPSGERGQISLTLTPALGRSMDLGQGKSLDQVGGTLKIESDWYAESITLHGLNDIQLAYRLLWIADIVIQKACRDNGYQLYKYMPGDVDRDFGIYN